MNRMLRSAIFTVILAILLAGSPDVTSSTGVSDTSTQDTQKNKKKKKKKKKSKKKSTKPKKKKTKKKKSQKKKKKKSSKKRSTKKKSKTKKQSKKKPAKKSSRKRPVKKSEAPSERPESVTPEVSKVSQADIYTLSGNIYRLNYDLDASMRSLEKASMRLKPADKPKERYISVDRVQLAEEKVQSSPDDRYAQRELALEYERHGSIAKAKDIYLRMVAQDPSNPDYHYYLGSLYSRNGQHYRAKAFYEEALEIDPNHSATISALTSYGKGERGDKMASELYGKAADKIPDGQADLISKIRVNISSSDFDEAIYQSENGRVKYPDNYIFPLLAGKAYEQSGNIEEAKKSYKVSVELSKTDHAPAVMLGDLYFDMDNYLYAAIMYEKAIAIKPLDVDVRYKFGLSYFKAYEWSKSASAWEDLLHYAPNHQQVRSLLPQVYYVMSLEYARTGYTDLGRRSFANAMSVNPSSGDWLDDALRTAGEFYREHGMYRQALNAYQDAIDLTPDHAENFNGLGSTYWAMQERELAIAAWERSISIQPYNNSATGWLLIARRSSG